MFDYINDIFGKERQHKTRFTDIEQRALRTIYNYVEGRLDAEKTFNNLNEIRKEFYDLMNVDGQITFDQDTPLWMNSFFGFKYRRWSIFQSLKKHFLEHPEELTGESAARYEEICQMDIDQEFMDACKYIIEEHPSIK